MNSIRRRWVMDDIIIRLKKNIYGVKYISYFFSHLNYILNYYESSKNSNLKNIHFGETCYVLGNGISLSEINLTKLNNSYTFACNEIFLHSDFDKLNCSYYTVMEPYYGYIMGKEYYSDTIKLYSDINEAFSEKKTVFFFHGTIKKVLKRKRYLLNKEIHYVVPLNEQKKFKKLSNNLSGSFSFGQGAFSFMIAAAIYMGFKKIVLIGCGYTFSPRQQFHFYARPSYNKSKYTYELMLNEVEKIIKNNNDLFLIDIEDKGNHYIPIFGSKFKEDRTTAIYRAVKKLADDNKVDIINIHPEGYTSPIFKGYTWEQYKTKFNAFIS